MDFYQDIDFRNHHETLRALRLCKASKGCFNICVSCKNRCDFMKLEFLHIKCCKYPWQHLM